MQQHSSNLSLQAVRLKEKKLANEIIAVSCGPAACQVRGEELHLWSVG